MDEHRNDPLQNRNNFKPIFSWKQPYSQNVPQNVLKCSWILITVPIPLLNRTEVFVWVVYSWFPTTCILQQKIIFRPRKKNCTLMTLAQGLCGTSCHSAQLLFLGASLMCSSNAMRHHIRHVKLIPFLVGCRSDGLACSKSRHESLWACVGSNVCLD